MQQSTPRCSAMSRAGRIKHLDLEPRCGACGDVIFEHERVVALYGNAGPTRHGSFGPNRHGYSSHTGPFPYPLVHYPEASIGSKQLCTRPGCGLSRILCPRNPVPETVTVHHQCFCIYMQETAPTLGSFVAEYRLYNIGLYKSPWPRAIPLSFANAYYLSQTALFRTASMCGLPQLVGYPAELLEMIRQYSTHSLFWRAISVLALAERVRATNPERLLIVPLYEIDRWERGGMLERWQPLEDTPTTHSESKDLVLEPPPPSLSSRCAVVRLTIDADGIQKIELLPDRPPYVRERTESLAYMVEELATLKGVDAHFEDGLVQLYSKPGYPIASLRIWDTPAPPSLSQCTIFSDKKRPWRQFRTVEFDSVTGLTFFYLQGALLGIHPHRSNDICASSSYERLALNESRRQKVSWIYYPVSPSDRIQIFGARPVEIGVNILIRSRFSGDVVLGSWGRGTARDTWRRKEPTTLIYGEPPNSCPIPYLGTYCRYQPGEPESSISSSSSISSPPGLSLSNASINGTAIVTDPRARYQADRPFPTYSTHVPFQPPHTAAGPLYFAIAPLKGLISAQVFYSPRLPSAPSSSDTSSEYTSDNSETKGIILRYRNGGCRALGEVRLHVDKFVTVENPTHASIQLQGVDGRQKAWIKFMKIKPSNGRRGKEGKNDSEGESNDAGDERPSTGGDSLPRWPLNRDGLLRFWFNDSEQHIRFRFDDVHQ